MSIILLQLQIHPPAIVKKKKKNPDLWTLKSHVIRLKRKSAQAICNYPRNWRTLKEIVIA